MKRLITNYTFLPSQRKVIFNDYNSITLEGILLITNVTRGEIIYNFADPNKGGTVSGNVLTLTYDTTQMSATDKLQIFYDDAYEVINALTMTLQQLIQTPLGKLSMDSAGRLRILVDASGTTLPVSQSGNWMFPAYAPGSMMFQLANIEYNECQRSKFTFI